MTSDEFVDKVRDLARNVASMDHDEILDMADKIARLVQASWPIPVDVEPLPPDYWESAK